MSNPKYSHIDILANIRNTHSKSACLLNSTSMGNPVHSIKTTPTKINQVKKKSSASTSITSVRQKAELLARLNSLKDQTDIPMKEYTDENTIEELNELKLLYEKLIFIEGAVKTYKLYMAIFFIGAEFAIKYLELPFEGITEFLINNMPVFEQWLILLAEENYVPFDELDDDSSVEWNLLKEISIQVTSYVATSLLKPKLSGKTEFLVKFITEIFAKGKYELLMRTLLSPNVEAESLDNVSDSSYVDMLVGVKNFIHENNIMNIFNNIKSWLPMMGINIGGDSKKQEEQVPKRRRPRVFKGSSASPAENKH